MAQDWLIEFLLGTGKLFLNPVFYMLCLLAAFLGVSRVKRERRNFKVRVENAYFELRQLVPIGLLVGVILSVIIVSVGVVIPFEAVILTSGITLLLVLTTRVRLISPAYTLGLAIIALAVIDWQNWSLPYFSDFSLDTNGSLAAIILLGLLTVGEGIIILANGPKGTSPKLIKGKRGHTVGVHELKRAWLLPVFLLIPGDVLQLPFSWWPVLSFGGETYSLLLVPFAVGIQQQVQAMLPLAAVKLHGKRVVILGVVTAILAAGVYFLPLASIGIAAFVIIAREIITWIQCNNERNSPFYFSQQNNGLMILGVLLNSPASKMELKVGEILTKVNGQTIHDENSYYEALQRNGAHCKLEVLDVSGEVRFVQRALYEGDHHELGLLFVQNEKKKGSKAV